uniref:Uncharacterized protein n=1 Tax=Panagrolaimus superbus TaxID=310955 RepID=A0A914YHM3_9BILA
MVAEFNAIEAEFNATEAENLDPELTEAKHTEPESNDPELLNPDTPSFEPVDLNAGLHEKAKLFKKM